MVTLLAHRQGKAEWGPSCPPILPTEAPHPGARTLSWSLASSLSGLRLLAPEDGAEGTVGQAEALGLEGIGAPGELASGDLGRQGRHITPNSAGATVPQGPCLLSGLPQRVLSTPPSRRRHHRALKSMHSGARLAPLESQPYLC